MQQRPHEMQARIEPLHRVHARQTGQSAATAEIGENRLRLIFGVMGQQNDPGVVFLRHAQQERMPRFSRRCFDGKTTFFGQRRHIRLLDLAFQLQLLRHTPDERCIAIGFLAPQAVIEMAEDQIREPGLP